MWMLAIHRNGIDISTINHSEIGVMFTNLANHGVPSCTKVLFFTAWCWISRKKFFELRDKYGHHENLCYLASTCFLNWCICKQKQERKRRIDHWLANFQNPSTSWCVVPNLFHKDSKQSQTVAPLHGQLDVAYVVISHVEQQLQSLILHISLFFHRQDTVSRPEIWSNMLQHAWFFKSIRISVAAQVGKRLIVINFGLQKYEVGRCYCLAHFLLLIPLQIANDAIIRKK